MLGSTDELVVEELEEVNCQRCDQSVLLQPAQSVSGGETGRRAMADWDLGGEAGGGPGVRTMSRWLERSEGTPKAV